MSSHNTAGTDGTDWQEIIYVLREEELKICIAVHVILLREISIISKGVVFFYTSE